MVTGKLASKLDCYLAGFYASNWARDGGLGSIETAAAAILAAVAVCTAVVLLLRLPTWCVGRGPWFWCLCLLLYVLKGWLCVIG